MVLPKVTNIRKNLKIVSDDEGMKIANSRQILKDDEQSMKIANESWRTITSHASYNT